MRKWGSKERRALLVLIAGSLLLEQVFAFHPPVWIVGFIQGVMTLMVAMILLNGD